MHTNPNRCLSPRRLAALAASALLALSGCKSTPEASEPVPLAEPVALCDSSAQPTDVAAAPSQPVGQCRPEAPGLAEVPATFDCSQPPPVVACCKALLPRCTACVDRNRDIDAAWRASCQPDKAASPETGTEPANVPPAPPITTP